MTSDTIDALEAGQVDTETSLGLARHVMGKLIRPINIDEILFQHWVLPSEDFSGDIVAAQMTVGGRMHLILADGTGHGLAAALCMMPVSEIFYTMTEKGFPIASIARELNRKMTSLLPTDRFVAASLVSVDWTERTIEIWNGGGPPAFFLNEAGQCLKSWKSNHLPLGILNDQMFDDKAYWFQWDEPGQLFLHSDGLADARDEKDELFGSERMHRALVDTDYPSRFEHLKSCVLKHIGGLTGNDDISLVALHCDLPPDVAASLKSRSSDVAANTKLSAWGLRLHLDAEEIKKVDVLPMLLTWLKQTGISRRDSQRLFLILAELYNNAVDHGLLGLDSSMKSSSSGFEGYLNKRAERLAGLVDATIDLSLNRKIDAGEDLIVLKIKDSSTGFDYARHLKGEVSSVASLAGRGIMLVNSLSKKLSYSGHGNEVTVEYLLGAQEN